MSHSAEFDLVVRGGTVVDGTSAAPRSGDVAVRDGRIVEVGTVSGRGAREITAEGALVAPGFVDIHTHYDGQATWDEQLQPSSWHGVTTVVAGNCGVGFAPARPEHRDRLIELMEGIEDIPETALHAGLTWEWDSFPEFLDALESQPRDIDLGTQVPHAALRVNVMAERALAGALATADDIEAMSQLAREAINAGALGFSTSRTINHKTLSGEVTPSYDAGSDELIAISRAVGRTGTGVLQYVTDWDDVDIDMKLIRSMATESGRPLSASVLQHPLHPDTYRAVLAQISLANDDGLQIRAQVGARAIGLMIGLQCTLHPFMTNPTWKSIAHLPVAEQARTMADPAFKEQMLTTRGERDHNRLGAGVIRQFAMMYELGDPPNYEPEPSQSLAARAEREGRTALDLAYDLLIAREGKALLYVPGGNYAGGNLDVVHEMLTHPHSVPGLSDGGAHVGTICDASFPTTLLQHWVRDRKHDRLPIEFVIARQARDTAHAVGLDDRGVLKPGYRADLNVIDLEGLTLHSPEMTYDLPAGKGRLLQRVDGYLHTFVNGVETYRDGAATGDLPGRLIRGARAAASS